jgi:hypothetical protein
MAYRQRAADGPFGVVQYIRVELQKEKKRGSLSLIF